MDQVNYAFKGLHSSLPQNHSDKVIDTDPENPGCNKLFKYIVQLQITITAIRNYHTAIRKIANNLIRNREIRETEKNIINYDGS